MGNYPWKDLCACPWRGAGTSGTDRHGDELLGFQDQRLYFQSGPKGSIMVVTLWILLVEGKPYLPSSMVAFATGVYTLWLSYILALMTPMVGVCNTVGMAAQHTRHEGLHHK